MADSSGPLISNGERRSKTSPPPHHPLCCPHPPPPPSYIHIRVIASDGLFPPFFLLFPARPSGLRLFPNCEREKTLGPDDFRRCSGIIGRTDGCISLTPFSQTIGSIQQRQTMRISAIFPSFLGWRNSISSVANERNKAKKKRKEKIFFFVSFVKYWEESRHVPKLWKMKARASAAEELSIRFFSQCSYMCGGGSHHVRAMWRSFVRVGSSQQNESQDRRERKRGATISIDFLLTSFFFFFIPAIFGQPK